MEPMTTALTAASARPFEILPRVESGIDLTAGQAAARLGALYGVFVIIRTLMNQTVQGLTVYSDEALYMEAARTILQGNGTWWDAAFSGLPNYLYPLLIAWPITHFPWETGFDLARSFNALAAGLTIFPSYALARGFVSRRRSLMVATLIATVPGMAYTMKLMTENVFLPLATLFMWLAWRAIVRPTAGRCLVAGLAAGLAFHAKPHALLLPPIYAGAAILFEWIRWRTGRDEEGSRPTTGRELVRGIGLHGFAALGLFAALLPRLAEVIWLEQWATPFSMRSFMGFYHYGVDSGQSGLNWPMFWQALCMNGGTWWVGAAILPAVALGRDARAVFGGSAPTRERALWLLAVLAGIAIVLTCARHVATFEREPTAYERYIYPFLTPVLLYFLFRVASQERPGMAVLISRSGRLIAIALGLAFGVFATWRLEGGWSYPSNTPTLSIGLLIARWRDVSPLLIGGWGVLAGAGVLVMVGAPRGWRLNWWGVWLWLLAANVGFYAVHADLITPGMRAALETAEELDRSMPRGHQLIVLRDGIKEKHAVAEQISFRVPGREIYIDESLQDWFAEPVKVDENLTLETGLPADSTWVLTAGEWRFNRPPRGRVGSLRRYSMADGPLMFDRAQYERYLEDPQTLKENDFRKVLKDLQFSVVSASVPAVLAAGEETPLRFRIRNDGFFATPEPGEVRYEIGYHWSAPNITGDWTAIVWDDGNSAAIPPGVARGQDFELTIPVRAPEEPHGLLHLELRVLGVKDDLREFGQDSVDLRQILVYPEGRMPDSTPTE